MTLEVDVERAQVAGPAGDVRALLDGDDPPAAVAEVPLLEAGLAAAREPLARVRVTGLPEPFEGFAGANAAALLLTLGDGRLALRACTPSGFLGLLVRVVGLRPRPRHGDDAEIVLPAPLMARVLGERSAAAAELDAAATEALGEHLDACVAHWRIELYGPGDGWYLEVVDSERGLWTVEDRPGGAVALVPADATRVLDELAALPGHVGLGGGL
jgi:hypothetical protein